MFPDATFPPLTKLWVVLTIFAGALVVFHLVLVYWLKLGRIAWKWVDFCWLAFAVLGLIGAAEQARQAVAVSLVEIAEARTTVTYSPVRSLADIYSREGPVCRTFVRSEYSPPPDEFNRAQREYNIACEWFRKVALALPQQAEMHEITDEILLPEPNITEDDLKSILREFRQQIAYHNERARQLSEVRSAAARSDTQQALIMISPLLLAIALALRITKVTGEIRLG
jgi:hypothetical protein